MPSMRTRAALAFFVFSFAVVAFAGSSTKAKERVRELEARLGAAYFDLWRESKEDAHLLEAHRLGSPDAASALETAIQEGVKREAWQRVQGLLLEAHRGAPSGRPEAKTRSEDLARARGSVVLRRAKKHPIHYLVSLPPAWKPDPKGAKKWPVVVALEGAGCVWMNMLGPWISARGDRPYVLAT